MNVENVVGIYNLLKDRKDGTMDAYQTLREEYEKKYGTSYLDDVLSDKEKKLLNRLDRDAAEMGKLFYAFANDYVKL